MQCNLQSVQFPGCIERIYIFIHVKALMQSTSMYLATCLCPSVHVRPHSHYRWAKAVYNRQSGATLLGKSDDRQTLLENEDKVTLDFL